MACEIAARASPMRRDRGFMSEANTEYVVGPRSAAIPKIGIIRDLGARVLAFKAFRNVKCQAILADLRSLRMVA